MSTLTPEAIKEINTASANTQEVFNKYGIDNRQVAHKYIWELIADVLPEIDENELKKLDDKFWSINFSLSDINKIIESLEKQNHKKHINILCSTVKLLEENRMEYRQKYHNECCKSMTVHEIYMAIMKKYPGICLNYISLSQVLSKYKYYGFKRMDTPYGKHTYSTYVYYLSK